MRARLRTLLRHRLVRGAPARRTLWAVAFPLVASLLLSSAALPTQVSLQVGQVAPRTLKAPRSFVDRPATERLKQAAEHQVPPIYRESPRVKEAALGRLDGVLALVDAVRQRSGATPEERLNALKQQVTLSVADQDYAAVLQLDVPTFSVLAATARSALAAEFDRGVRPDDLDPARRRLSLGIRALPFPIAATDWFATLVPPLLAPDLTLDPAATREARDQAAKAVAPVFVLKGQNIVLDGERVTPDEMELLHDAGLLREHGFWGLWLGAALFAALLEGLIWGYLVRFRRDVMEREAAFVLLGVVAIVALAGIRLAFGLSGLLSPLPWAAMLIAVAFDPQLAVFLTLLLSVAVALLGHDPALGAVTLVAGIVAAGSVRRLHQRSDLLRAGLLAGAAGVLCVAILAMFPADGAPTGMLLAYDLAFAAANGILSGMLAIGSLPYLEYALGLLTPMRLLELANAQQPLLRRLLLEAPGTYHHSLMVANLAETAGQAIGADPLLVRVGAYYHDLGKVKRPYFFIENQLGGENPHDRLSPSLSALVITSHVQDGVDLAREHRLPEEVIDFIRTHHGTNLVSYFYQRAREAGECRQEGFRYPGPIPTTREQALVMLADGAEATVRAQRATEPSGIEAIVRRIVRERVEDGQLAGVDLTLRELEQVVTAFIHVLNGIYHQRIEYPEQALEDFQPPRAASL